MNADILSQEMNLKSIYLNIGSYLYSAERERRAEGIQVEEMNQRK
jgi:hypothetical protein